ncbi:hypothetical protein D9V32_00315 [Mycetocola tolaasinivorans]|uniref:protein-tyrosine-phosphatase n=1 Tax=Mycetocola tolaasinivorans TaxID=76635 RepID=A0A3L7ACS4_9MICO|nr:hypothetical protein [Mycetocola tolaasinivorans]RLP77815.1 hypothetical protein D9V32_00315 [Mycetocola tolaasinivorans]
MSNPTPAPKPIRLLTVCSANIARSPYLERRLQHDLDAAAPSTFLVDSAGTHSFGPPRRMASGTRERLARAGMSSENFRSAVISATHVRDVDLVITMTEQHRRDVLAEYPSVFDRIFTVGEMEIIAAQAPTGASARAKISAAQTMRPAIRGRHTLLDVDDPYGHGDAEFDAMARRLDAASALITAWITSPTG